jgi:hypothetical protein
MASNEERVNSNAGAAGLAAHLSFKSIVLLLPDTEHPLHSAAASSTSGPQGEELKLVRRYSSASEQRPAQGGWQPRALLLMCC